MGNGAQAPPNRQSSSAQRPSAQSQSKAQCPRPKAQANDPGRLAPHHSPQSELNAPGGASVAVASPGQCLQAIPN
jgi:hypothetical protein